MDYDRTDIRATYDRGHDNGPAVIDQWMRVIESHVEPARVRDILDLACGTGRFISGRNGISRRRSRCATSPISSKCLDAKMCLYVKPLRDGQKHVVQGSRE